MRNNAFGTVALSAAIGGVLAIGLGAASTANADLYSHNSASGMCKASAGPGAAVFYFNSTYVQNTSGSVQYLTCPIADASASASGLPMYRVSLHLDNPNAAAVNYTCVVQLHHGGSVATSAVYQIPATALNNHVAPNYYASSTPGVPQRTSSDEYYTMSCAIPAGARMVSIDTQLDEPL